MDQLVGFWDPIAQQFQGPGNVPAGSVEIFAGTQATGASGTVPLGIASRAGIIKDCRVAAITPLGAGDTYTVDIRRNGTTILTAPMALLSSTAARASVVGTLAASLAAVAVGDFFEAVATYTHATGTAPANVVFQVQLIEN